MPGRLVFDLDPAPDVQFTDVVRAARQVKAALESVGLIAFCKTTGGKGLHVGTPLDGDARAVSWDEAKKFALTLCQMLTARSPGDYVLTMAKKQRGGRICLDYFRNDRMVTAVAVLSPRARNGAPVSMPVPWGAVTRNLDPMRYTIRTAMAALRRDPWAGYAAAARPLPPLSRVCP